MGMFGQRGLPVSAAAKDWADCVVNGAMVSPAQDNTLHFHGDLNDFCNTVRQLQGSSLPSATLVKRCPKYGGLS